MDVDSFIAKYRPEWHRLETACARGSRGLARMSGREIQDLVALYLRASGHLAEVQTRYNDPSLQAYLNRVVSRAHGALYGATPRTVRGFVSTFGSRYRAALHRTAPFIGVAAALMIVGVAATAIWVSRSAEAQLGLLPVFAREALREIGADPRAATDPLGLSTVIMLNNVQVSFLAFAFGVMFCVGTIWIVTQNAILIGALAGAFHSVDRAGAFWSLVLPHGFLEITAISIAAGAGLRMGWALIDPGERARGVALVEEARDSVLVVTGVIPAFVIAAAIEGFMTGSGLPSWFEIGFGALVALVYIVFLIGPRLGGRLRASRTP